MIEQLIKGQNLIPPIMSGKKNSVLHLIVWFNKNKVKSINNVLFNGILIDTADLDSNGVVTRGFYANKAIIRKHLGEPNQAAEKLLVSEIEWWTTNHRFRGVAYLYVRLEWDDKIFRDGIPDISAWITPTT